MLIVAKKKIRYPISLERDYAKQLKSRESRCMSVVNDYIPEMKSLVQQYTGNRDADGDGTGVNANISVLVDRIDNAMESPEAMEKSIRKMFSLVSSNTKNQFQSITQSVFGVKMTTVPMIDTKSHGDADTAEIQQLEDLWVQQNIDLIKSIDSDTLQRIKNYMTKAITDNYDTGTLTKYLNQELKELTDITSNRAALIGTDQIGKITGRMTQYWQENAGIDSYQWETCHDSRVRDTHRYRQGIIYKWTNPPPDGNPGYPIRCRCVALPVFDVDKIPLKAKGTSYTIVNNAVSSAVANVKESSLKDSTTKLRETMPAADYNECLGIIEKNDDIKSLYVKYADNISGIQKVNNMGYYMPGSQTIKYSYDKSAVIGKYNTLFHEYGHFFDFSVDTSKLKYTEAQKVNDLFNTKLYKIKYIKRRASTSDEFIEAIRKDSKYIESIYSRDVEKELFATDASASVQDAISGMFSGMRMKWYHPESYYNHDYNMAKKLSLQKDLKSIYNGMGFDASNQGKVQGLCRTYKTGMEAWANITSAVLYDGEELKYIKKYMPNTYKAFNDILKGLNEK